MRKTFLYMPLLSCYLYAACSSNSQNNQSATDNHRDTVTVENSDSAKLVAKYGSSLHVAYGKANFGISEKEFNKLFKKYDTEKVGDDYYSIDGIFTKNGNKLYAVELYSLYKTANYVDADLQASLDNIASVITARYGEPEFDQGKPEFFRFKPGEFQVVKGWNILNKSIRIGMREKYSGSEYQVVCQIYDKCINEEEGEKSEQESNKNKSADAHKF
ncbi:hypothetical protein INP83_10890 [Mucilaginibacter sp. 21P]|uniref:hypothetical protein n=1 Tax=Mucilaginibacter sp. 21P TaxID=2778902 RepID=UPI001C565265|nr:hypothetical protein [Mucilaginibacter sp. 21P]QXV63623.1 hypothetical protein INP83_10890 [Mucilaginibacter sp. 21P]